jgi:fatty acid desaturase
LTIQRRAQTSAAMNATNSRRASRAKARHRDKESPGSLFRFILLLVVLAWALRSFVIAPFNIPSG